MNTPRGFRTAAIFAVTLASFAATARADAVDDARRRTDAARQALAAADGRLNWTQGRLYAAQSALSNLQNLQQTLPGNISNLQTAAQAASDAAAQAANQLPQLSAAVDNAAADVAAKLVTVRDAKDKLQLAQSQVDQARAAAEAVFAARPDVVAARMADDTANGKLAAASDFCVKAVMKTSAYQADASVAQAAETHVRDMRTQVSAGTATPQQLAEASKQWIAAKGTLEVRKNQALDDDPAVRAARSEAARADGLIRTLRAGFEQTLPAQPAMAAALAAMQQAGQQAVITAADLDAARSAQAAAQQRLHDVRARQSDALAAASQDNSNAAARQQQLDQVNANLPQAQNNVSQAQADLDQARRGSDDAARAYQDAQNNENNVRQQQHH